MSFNHNMMPKNIVFQMSLHGLLEEYELEAIEFLQKHEPPEGYFLGFSGGKDSIVCYHLCQMAEVKFAAYFACTGIDPPEIYKFIRKHYPEVIWKYPKMSFWAGIKKKGPPYRRIRWCCDILKKNPTKNIPLPHRIMGIRAEESAKRSMRPRIDEYLKKEILYKPIFHWLEWQVWEFIEKYRLSYPGLYDEGFDRIGCIVCPFLSKRKKAIAKERWPKTHEIFEKVVSEWWGIKNRNTEYSKYKTDRELIDNWYSD
jgi:phosphoadenosine phosphosulfate reductase